MTTWFTADFHLGHRNILKYCNRPFATVEEMNAVIIMRWQQRVSPEDEVYVLGDLAFLPPWRVNDILADLPGVKFFVRGNHDRQTQKWRGFQWVEDYHEMEINGYKLVLCHYPIEEWRLQGRGSFHFHGHSHGTRPHRGYRRQDVGVDCWNFEPVSYATLEAEMLSRKPRIYGGPQEQDD